MSKTSKKTNDKAKTNGRNGAEYPGVEPVNRGISESPQSVVANRKKTSPRREPSMAQIQRATSNNGESISTNNSSSPPSSEGPLKFRKTESRFETSQLSLAAVPPTIRNSDSYLCAELLLQQLRLVLPQRRLDPDGNHAVAALCEISPRDTIEGMLAVQMVVGHNLGLEFFRRATLPLRSSEEMQLDLNLATKLLRTYVAQVEALDRHRGKGEQKMNVEQLHIHDGAQGIVGPFSLQRSLDASAEGHGKSNGKSK